MGCAMDGYAGGFRFPGLHRRFGMIGDQDLAYPRAERRPAYRPSAYPSSNHCWRASASRTSNRSSNSAGVVAEVKRINWARSFLTIELPGTQDTCGGVVGYWRRPTERDS